MTLNTPQRMSTPASRWLLDIPEACRELHVSRAALFRLLAAGSIASIKLGRRRLIPVR
jgi:excisionase family DNA binding protein